MEYGEEIGLLDKENKQPTTFDKAYILFENEWIELEENVISTSESGYNYVWGYDVADFLVRIGKIENYWETRHSPYSFLIEKNGKMYIGDIKIIIVT